jgi:hypothetical protein
MKCWRVLLVLVACTAWCHDDEDKDETFEAVVQRIVRASRENLRPLKASRIEMRPSMHYWYEVTDIIPGAALCRIYEHPRMVYRCEWKSRSAGPLHDKLVKDLAAVLGTDEWTLHRSATGTRFEPVKPNRNGVVDVLLKPAGVEVAFYPVPRD